MEVLLRTLDFNLNTMKDQVCPLEKELGWFFAG